MQMFTLPLSIAQPFWPVKSTISNSPVSPNYSMIHHKDNSFERLIIYKIKGERISKPYGVSSLKKAFTPELLFKKFDQVCAFLRNSLLMPPQILAAALAFLTLQARYPDVYPKANQIAEMAHVSIPTVWRAVKMLEDMNLMEVVSRFLIRAEAQISNLYLLKNFVLAIIRYLAEHGVPFWQKWLRPVLAMPGQQFWSQVFRTPGVRAGPLIPTSEGP